MFKTEYFTFSLCVFLLINILLYFFIIFFNHLVPFNTVYYANNAYHYLPDPRYYHQGFDFFSALAQWDAQFYLHIAEKGYSQERGSFMYAFFPMYPLTLFVINEIVKNIELTAFILSFILLLADFISLYFVITKLYNEKIAFRTSLLMFLFPFSIFFRSYFSEGLFLFFLLWFSYFITTKKWFFASIFFAFLCVTRPTGLFLIPLYVFLMLKAVIDKKAKMSILKVLVYWCIAAIPLAGWSYYCYATTGNRYYWMNTDTGSLKASILHPIAFNITQLLHFGSLPFHYFGLSKVENITLLFVIAILILSKKRLKPELWWIAFLLAIPVIFLKDLISFSRFQSVSFPLFLYLAQVFSGKKFIALSAVFLCLLFITSLFFVNWYWIG